MQILVTLDQNPKLFLILKFLMLNKMVLVVL